MKIDRTIENTLNKYEFCAVLRAIMLKPLHFWPSFSISFLLINESMKKWTVDDLQLQVFKFVAFIG